MGKLALRFFRWFFRGIVRWLGGLTLLRVFLLWFIFISQARGLAVVVKHIQPEWLIPTAMCGILFGWLLARSRLAGWMSALFAIATGLIWIILTIGNLRIPIWALYSSLPPIMGQILQRISPDLTPLLKAWSTLSQSELALYLRPLFWYHNLERNIIVVVPTLTTLVWALVLWLTAIWAAWWEERREVTTLAILPAALTLALNSYYVHAASGILWLVLIGGGWVMLQAAENYLKANRHWEARHLDRSEFELPMAVIVLLLSAGIMLAGNFLPTISIKKITDTWNDIFHQKNETLAGPNGLQASKPGTVWVRGQSYIHTIGPGVHLSRDVVMYVAVEGYSPPPVAVVEQAGLSNLIVRYYWRSQTYDRYNGYAWFATTGSPQEFASNSPLYPSMEGLPGNYKLVRQTVERTDVLGNMLYSTGDLLSADHAYFAIWHGAGDIAYALTDSNTYVAESRVQNVTIEQLRAAGTNYPQAIMQRYLNLPDLVPQRVSDLALQLTVNLSNPYDRAVAIESYLRQFPYSLDVPAPPVERDVADFFIFDLKKGYCDYYATSMAELARAAGIPSRLVIGYTTGDYNYDTRRFVVRKNDLHAWVEVYFPDIGWVEFEPTANQARFVRPGKQPAEASVVSPIPIPQETPAPRLEWTTLRGPLGIAGMVLVCLVLLSFLPVNDWLLYLFPSNRAVATIFRRLYRQGHRWGVETDVARTPYEFVLAFSTRLERRATNQRLASVVTVLRADLDCLTSLYNRLLFSPHPLTHDEHYQAVRIWAHLRRTLFRLQRR